MKAEVFNTSLNIYTDRKFTTFQERINAGTIVTVLENYYINGSAVYIEYNGGIGAVYITCLKFINQSHMPAWF